MIETKYKIEKIKYCDDNGVQRKKLAPLRRVSILGFGVWREDPAWEEVERNIAEEKRLGLDPDSTLIQIRRFIANKNPTLKNKFYN